MDENSGSPLTEYKETKIGKTLYQVTSVYLGKIELQAALEELIIRKALEEITKEEAASCGEKGEREL